MIRSSITKIKINFKGREVTAHKLTVASEIPMDIETAWAKVLTSALLNFVVKGKVTFNPTGGKFPERWEEGSTVTTKMKIYGFIPMGGLHTLFFEKIDNINKVLQTREWDNSAQVWDHNISMKKISINSIYYKDEVIIYAGMMTGFISFWAKSFYTHRQKRWQLLASSKI